MKKIASNNYGLSQPDGFTIIETMVSLSVLVILFFISIPIFKNFDTKSKLDQAREDLINTIRLAQKKTVSSENQGNWGVYLSTSTVPNKAVIFFGKNYASRTASFDDTKILPANVRISDITPNDMEEIVFERITGNASTSVEIGLELSDLEGTHTAVHVDRNGIISPYAFSPSDSSGRTKDTRHIHFTYQGTIDTLNDNIYLNFENGTYVETVPLSTNMVSGQFSYKGNITVTGAKQVLEIKSFRINSPDSLFCVIRDRRYNNKAVKISVGTSLLSSNSLLSLSADGLSAATGTSIFVSGPIWQ